MGKTINPNSLEYLDQVCDAIRTGKLCRFRATAAATLPTRAVHQVFQCALPFPNITCVSADIDDETGLIIPSLDIFEASEHGRALFLELPCEHKARVIEQMTGCENHFLLESMPTQRQVKTETPDNLSRDMAGSLDFALLNFEEDNWTDSMTEQCFDAMVKGDAARLQRVALIGTTAVSAAAFTMQARADDLAIRF